MPSQTNKFPWHRLERDVRSLGSVAAVAAAWGCPTVTVSREAWKQGLTWAFAFTDQEWLRREYVVKGRAQTSIAKECHVAKATIRPYVLALGVPIRGPMYVEKVPLVCPYCGRSVLMPPNEAKNQTYCSISCGQKARLERGEQPIAAPVVKHGRSSEVEELIAPHLPTFQRQYVVQKWRPKKRKSVYRIDFARPDILLAVEFDGSAHRHPKCRRKDQERDEHLRSLGWTIMRFENREVTESIFTVLAKIQAEAGRLTATKSAQPA